MTTKETFKAKYLLLDQTIADDVLYNPCLTKTKKAEESLLSYQKFDREDKNWNKGVHLKTPTDDTISAWGLDANFAILFVDEATRWKTVVPLR